MKGSSWKTGWPAIALAAAMAGCGGSDEIVIECGERQVSIDEIVAAATASDPELSPELRTDRAIGEQLLLCAVLAEPMNKDEVSDVERADRWRRAQRCVDIELKRRLAARGDVTVEARDSFENDPEAFLPPESFQLQLIFLPIDEPSGEDLAAEILTRVRERPDAFTELARAHSKSGTTAQGGITNSMPGTTVNPAMRKAIGEHQSGEPFLVATENGWFIARVLQYWPPVRGSWEEAAPNVIREVGQELVRAEIKSLMAQVREEHEVAISHPRFLEPLVPAEESVYTIDDRSIAVSDLFPGLGDSDQVPGPTVGSAVGAFRRWYEPAVALSCFDEETTFEEDLLFRRRLGPALTDAADRLMDEEIRHFSLTHRDVLHGPNTYLFDLWLFPFTSNNPYGDLQHYGPSMDAIRNGESEIDDPDLRSFLQLEMSEPQLAAYEPFIEAALNRLEPGSFSEPIRSRRLRSFVIVRLEHRTEGHALSPDNEEDRREIIRRFLTDSYDEVLDTYSAHLRNDCRVAPDLEKRVIRELERPSADLPG